MPVKRQRANSSRQGSGSRVGDTIARYTHHSIRARGRVPDNTLTRNVVARRRESQVHSARFSDTIRVLSEAIASLAAERSLGGVLQRIADLAREVLGARYAALGVADADGRIIEFHTSGLTPDERAAIGPLPRGHGLLGVLIREGRPVRVAEDRARPPLVGLPA